MSVERGPVTGVKRHLFPPPTILKQKEKARAGTSCIILHTVQEPRVRQVSRGQASCPEDMEIKDQGKGVRDRVLKELTLETLEELTELTNQVTNRYERS